jgi:Neuraminidase (sialidase)
LTGDQSITDALSCCSTKNIFYQIAPWKKDFAKNLATYMPNIFLKSVKTSCGTLKALKYKSNYFNFVKNNDFRLIGKTKLDAILLSSISMKHNADISDLVSLVNKTPNIKILKSKIRKMIEY